MMNHYLIDKLIEKGYIQENTRDSYQYGFLVLILNLIPIIIIVGFSAITKRLEFGIIFLISFVPIRINIGGFHCKKFHNCMFSFIIIYISIMYLSITSFRELLKIFGLICIVLIYFLKPITYDLIENERYNYIKSKRIIKNVCFLMIIINFVFNDFQLIIAMHMACILNVSLYFMGLIDLRKRGTI